MENIYFFFVIQMKLARPVFFVCLIQSLCKMFIFFSLKRIKSQWSEKSCLVRKKSVFHHDFPIMTIFNPFLKRLKVFLFLIDIFLHTHKQQDYIKALQSFSQQSISIFLYVFIIVLYFSHIFCWFFPCLNKCFSFLFCY